MGGDTTCTQRALQRTLAAWVALLTALMGSGGWIGYQKLESTASAGVDKLTARFDLLADRLVTTDRQIAVLMAERAGRDELSRERLDQLARTQAEMRAEIQRRLDRLERGGGRPSS